MARKKMGMKRQEAVKKWTIFTIITLGALTMLYPLAWMISTSFKLNEHTYTTGLIPKVFTIRNYVDIWTEIPLLRGFFNSTFIVLPSVIIGSLVSVLAAFSYAKIDFKYKNIIFLLMLSVIMIPFPVVMLPQFVVFSKMGLLQGPWALILPKLFGNVMMIFFIKQYLSNIPNSIIESAKMDGAGYFKIFRLIIIPLAWPAIVAQAILGFMGVWNDYLAPLLFIKNPEWRTLPVIIAEYNSQYAIRSDIPKIMAASLISMIPVLIVFAIFQRSIINSVMLSGVKE